MVNVPVFTDATPQGFYDRLLASKPMPDTGKPDPQKMAAFLGLPSRDRSGIENHQAITAEHRIRG